MNQIGRSRNARLNQAIKHAAELMGSLTRLSGWPADEHVDQKLNWQVGREELAQLVQCFHEANAYNNALLAQRIEHQPSKLGVEGSNPSERANHKYTVGMSEGGIG